MAFILGTPPTDALDYAGLFVHFIIPFIPILVGAILFGQQACLGLLLWFLNAGMSARELQEYESKHE